ETDKDNLLFIHKSSGNSYSNKPHETNIMQQDDFSLADTAATFLLSKTPLRPKIGLVLGSGLGAFADELADAARIPYEQIPSFPRSTAIGHAGQMVIGKADGIPLAAM